MSKSILLISGCLGALLFLACSKAEVTTNRNATTPTSTVPAASPAATTATTVATTGEKIGVAECDEFITAYDNCVSTKVPEQVRAQYKTALANWRSSWKKLADNPQTKSTLAGVCKQTIEAQRTAVKSFGCTL